MTAREKYSRVLAIHEAGHAVVAVRLDLMVYGVHMRHRRAKRDDPITTERGRTVRAQGMVESSHNINPALYKIQTAHGMRFHLDRQHALNEIAVSAAGPFAEAKFSHRAECGISLFGGGSGDLKAAREVAALFPDARDILDEGWLLGRKFVHQNWTDIIKVADLIQNQRHTDGEVIHRALEVTA